MLERNKVRRLCTDAFLSHHVDQSYSSSLSVTRRLHHLKLFEDVTVSLTYKAYQKINIIDLFTSMSINEWVIC